MLGEKIGESHGRITGRRVLANPGGAPRMEVSFESSGTALGVDLSEVGTYWSELRPDGTLFGEGQGILTGKGGEVLTWVGQGVGSARKDGGVTYRGAVYYRTSSPALARLNSVAAVFEYEADAQGNTRAQIWEWK
jgi:hypothetical protein